MQTPSLRRLGALLLGLAFLTALQPAFGQVITTSSLGGTVRSEQGLPVAGAAIAVTHQPTGAVFTATTRTDGSYILHGLRPGGPYSVGVTASGSARAETRDVFLDIDRTADVDFKLVSGDVVTLDSMAVTASSMDHLFNPGQTGSGSTLSSTEIANLPAGDRSINSLARLDSRITYNRDPFDRAISVSGLSNRYNSIQVDGVSASDPFGLNANNTAAERNVVPLDSIESLTVNTSPYFSRNAGFVGAQINAVTKSGGNDFHGSVYYLYRGRSALGIDLVGTTLDGLSRPLNRFSEETVGATFNGPIVPKKLFFALSFDRVNEERLAPSPVARLPEDTLAQIKAAAEALGFKPGSATPPTGNKLTDRNVAAKIDWDVANGHRAVFRYNTVKSSRPTFPSFGSGIAENNLSFDSAWYQQNTKNTSYIGQLISRWNEKLNTELAVSQSAYHSEPKNSTRQPYVQVRGVAVPGSSNTSFVTFGTEQSRHANILDVKTDTAEGFASYQISDTHTLQAGFQYEVADIYNLFVQNAYGYYDFNNLQQFLDVAALNNGTRNYRTFSYNQIVAGVDPAARFAEANLGLFINDAWRATSTLKIDAGLRIDTPYLPDAIPYNAAFAAAFGVRNDHTYDGARILQPRVGFNWQPRTQLRTTFRGGFGLFYGRTPRVWVSNSYSNTGFNYRTWSAGTNPTAGSATQAPPVSANPDSQPTLGNTPAQQVAFMDPSFHLPSRWKGNLAVERELGRWSLKVSAELEWTWVRDDIFTDNINLQATGIGPDGRLLYFNTYAASSSGTRLVNTAFTNRIIRLRNTGKGSTNAFTFAVERPRKKDGWSWKASYVHTKAEEAQIGTSSVAGSNWNNRSVFNVNAQELHRADLEVKDKILFNLTKDLELLKGHKTSFSLLYEGRSGYPFSFVYTSDANGDSQTQNDLLYVPNRSGDATVRFATAADQVNFFKIVDRFRLTEGRPMVANERNYPWVNQFDLGVKQTVKLPGWRHKIVLGMDILNLGNLLNNEWGVIRGSNQFFAKKEAIASAAYDGVAKQWVYSSVNTNLANGVAFAPALGRGEPAATRWSVLLSARYEF